MRPFEGGRGPIGALGAPSISEAGSARYAFLRLAAGFFLAGALR